MGRNRQNVALRSVRRLGSVTGKSDALDFSMHVDGLSLSSPGIVLDLPLNRSQCAIVTTEYPFASTAYLLSASRRVYMSSEWSTL